MERNKKEVNPTPKLSFYPLRPLFFLFLVLSFFLSFFVTQLLMISGDWHHRHVSPPFAHPLAIRRFSFQDSPLRSGHRTVSLPFFVQWILTPSRGAHRTCSRHVAFWNGMSKCYSHLLFWLFKLRIINLA